eukprot:9731132-Alexandrium_andersonii.AAC.1
MHNGNARLGEGLARCGHEHSSCTMCSCPTRHAKRSANLHRCIVPGNTKTPNAVAMSISACGEHAWGRNASTC